MNELDIGREMLVVARRHTAKRADDLTIEIARAATAGLEWESTRMRELRTALRTALGDIGAASRALNRLDEIIAEART